MSHPVVLPQRSVELARWVRAVALRDGDVVTLSEQGLVTELGYTRSSIVLAINELRAAGAIEQLSSTRRGRKTAGEVPGERLVRVVSSSPVWAWLDATDAVLEDLRARGVLEGGAA